jgi:hypothetical protein
MKLNSIHPITSLSKGSTRNGFCLALIILHSAGAATARTAKLLSTNMCCCIYKATKEYAYQGRHFMSIMGFKLGESITPINQGWIVLKTDTEYTDHLGEETALTRRLDPRGAEQNTRFYNIGIQLRLQCDASLVVTTDIKKEARLVAGGIQLRILNSIYVSGSS